MEARVRLAAIMTRANTSPGGPRRGAQKESDGLWMDRALRLARGAAQRGEVLVPELVDALVAHYECPLRVYAAPHARDCILTEFDVVLPTDRPHTEVVTHW